MKSIILILIAALSTALICPRAVAQDAGDIADGKKLVAEGYYSFSEMDKAIDISNKLNSNEIHDAKGLVDDGIFVSFDEAANLVWRSDAQDRTCARIHMKLVNNDFRDALQKCVRSYWDD